MQNLQSSWKNRMAVASDVVRHTLQSVPAALREPSMHVLVSYERCASPRDLQEGVEPDTMGLFEGCTFAEEPLCNDTLPPRIRLFLDEIMKEADGNDEAFREEVRVTYLHELGHYLGLSEDELWERNLG